MRYFSRFQQGNRLLQNQGKNAHYADPGKPETANATASGQSVTYDTSTVNLEIVIYIEALISCGTSFDDPGHVHNKVV